MESATKLKKVFEDKYNLGGNLKYVHPSKQEAVKEILEVIPDSLEELWLFGSSVTGSCKESSDIDLCLVGNTTHEEEKLIYMTTKCAVDIIRETPEGFLAEQSNKGSIYKQVYDTGVLIYEKGVGVKAYHTQQSVDGFSDSVHNQVINPTRKIS